jgi:hypothetical protein
MPQGNARLPDEFKVSNSHSGVKNPKIQLSPHFGN